MIFSDFQKLFDAAQERRWRLMRKKGDEYSTEDKLHNFKKAAGGEGITPAQALWGMYIKHHVSVSDMVDSGNSYLIEQWLEKLDDMRNYLDLLEAIVREDAPRTLLESVLLELRPRKKAAPLPAPRLSVIGKNEVA